MEFNEIATSINIKLYKYNYIDNKLWGQIKNQTHWVEPYNNSVVVSVDQIIELLEMNYSDTLRKVAATGFELIHQEVNSAYFIHTIIEEMPLLEYIKFNLDFDKSYSRMVDNEDEKLLRFDYKVLTATLRMYDFFTKSELRLLNTSLQDASIMPRDAPYIRSRLSDLSSSVDKLAGTIEDDRAGDLLAGLMDIIDTKIHNDNPLILLVTDY